MFKRTLWVLVFTGLLCGVTLGQSRQPANITTTPPVLPPAQLPATTQLLDSTGTWTPTGQIYPSSHVYSPSGVGGIDVTTIGMRPGGFDNSALNDKLMEAISIASENSSPPIIFPPVIGQRTTSWYFSKPLVISRPTSVDCKTILGQYEGNTLVFPPGVDGVRLESGYYTRDGGWGEGDINGCSIVSQGEAEGSIDAVGGNTATFGFHGDIRRSSKSINF